MITSFNCPAYLNSVLDSMCGAAGTTHFQIRSALVSEIIKTNIISAAFQRDLTECSNIIGIYLKKDQYTRYWLAHYKAQHRNFHSDTADLSKNLLAKIKLMSRSGHFEAAEEQQMTLMMGIISRLQKSGFYKIKTLKEVHYKGLEIQSRCNDEYDLVHLIALSALQNT